MNKFKFLWFAAATCVLGVFLLSGCTSSEQQSGDRSNRSKREAAPTEPTREAKRAAPAPDEYKAPLALHQEATERETLRRQTARQEISQSDYTQPVARQTIKTSYERDVYTCPMHPAVQSTQPGSCPTCGMALMKKSEQGAAAACQHCGTGSAPSGSSRSGGGGCGSGCCK